MSRYYLKPSVYGGKWIMWKKLADRNVFIFDFPNYRSAQAALKAYQEDELRVAQMYVLIDGHRIS